jgi:hypothetical protein
VRQRTPAAALFWLTGRRDAATQPERQRAAQNRARGFLLWDNR